MDDVEQGAHCGRVRPRKELRFQYVLHEEDGDRDRHGFVVEDDDDDDNEALSAAIMASVRAGDAPRTPDERIAAHGVHADGGQDARRRARVEQGR